jgi:hypothetical protein
MFSKVKKKVLSKLNLSPIQASFFKAWPTLHCPPWCWPNHAQILLGSFHSNHGYRSLRTTANIYMWSTPWPSSFSGRQTTSQFTLLLARVAGSLANKERHALIYWSNSR